MWRELERLVEAEWQGDADGSDLREGVLAHTRHGRALQAGTYALHITNKGTITHAFEVEGNGVEEKSGDIQAGSSATLTVTFAKNGSYEIYCPVDGHKQQGMKGTLTVGTAAGNGGTTTEGNTTTTSKIPGY